jgi:hypothetical protein
VGQEAKRVSGGVCIYVAGLDRIGEAVLEESGTEGQCPRVLSNQLRDTRDAEIQMQFLRY